MNEVLDTGEVGRPRREPEEPQFLDAEQAEALIEQAREQGVGDCALLVPKSPQGRGRD